jgi:ribosomal protein L37AE/L43A
MSDITKLLKEASDGGAIIIAETEPMICSDCGEEDELRPYGKDGAWVCYDCGMKDEEEAKKQFNKQFDEPKHKSGNA